MHGSGDVASGSVDVEGRISSSPKAPTNLVNGAVRKGERMVPPSAVELLMGATFPAPTSCVKVIQKDEATSHDNKQLFYSTLKNDNPLDCIVSKVKVLKVAPIVNLKSIPPCDYYYDMKYNIDYSTFSTIKDDADSDSCCMSTSPNKEEIHSNGSKININGTINKEQEKQANHKKISVIILIEQDLLMGFGVASESLNQQGSKAGKLEKLQSHVTLLSRLESRSAESLAIGDFGFRLSNFRLPFSIPIPTVTS
ncbi:hypothetical protein L1887_10254 [Cichorium endivia]|nr:hypothetical protein L1887_10254 [Cichorium endivia]